MQKPTEPHPDPSAEAAPASAGVGFLLDTIKSLERRCSCLLEVARFVREIRDFHELLGRLLAKAAELVGADAGVIALADKASGEFKFVNVHYGSLPPLEAGKKEKMLGLIRLKLSDGIIGDVFASGEPRVVSDLAHNSVFRRDVSDTVNYEIKNLMALPLSVDGDRLGVVEFLNKTPPGAFGPLDVDLASAVASQIALLVEAHRLREDGHPPAKDGGAPDRSKEKDRASGALEEKAAALDAELKKAREGAAAAAQAQEKELQKLRAEAEAARRGGGEADRRRADTAEEKSRRLSEDMETAFRLNEKSQKKIEELSRALEEKRNDTRPREHQQALMKAFAAVSSSQPTELVLDTLLSSIATVLDAEAASLILVDEETDQLYFAAATGHKKDPLKKILLKEGEGIAGWVAKHGKVLIIPDVARDPRFSDQADKSADFKTRSVLAVPLFSDSRLIGVAEAVNKKEGAAFSEEDGQTLVALSLYGAMAIRKAQIYWDMNELFLSTVRALADGMETKGAGGKGRSERVRRLALALAEELAVVPGQFRDVELAAILHDVGKIILPERLLQGTAELTEEDARLLARTPVVAAEILADARPLKNVVPLVRHVHERWDGEGYPDKLKGDAIPRGSRIIAAAVTFEAMTADRPYRRRLPEELAVKEVQSLRGVQLDPEAVDALVRLYRKGKLKDLFK